MQTEQDGVRPSAHKLFKATQAIYQIMVQNLVNSYFMVMFKKIPFFVV